MKERKTKWQRMYGNGKGKGYCTDGIVRARGDINGIIIGVLHAGTGQWAATWVCR